MLKVLFGLIVLLLFTGGYADIPGFPFSDGAAQCTYYDTNFPSSGSSYSTGFDAQTCDQAELTSTARADVLRVVNMYRYFSGLDPVTSQSSSGEFNASACALMCHEKGALQHTGWTGSDACYTDQGASGCASSNLAAGLSAPNDNIALWVWDGTGTNNLGHRLWILHPSLGDIGFGLADNYAALYVFGSQSYTWTRGWYSWPPEGVTPAAAMYSFPLNFHYVDQNFTSYANAPEIVTCDVLDANCNSVRSGNCYSDPAGFGNWGAIKIPTSVSGAGCYTVDLAFRAEPGGEVFTRKYISNIWDCTQTDGGATCLTASTKPDCTAKTSSSSASHTESWVSSLL